LVLLARNHHRIRLFVGSAVCLSSVVVLGGRAYADDPAPSTPDSVAESTPPSPPPAASDPAPSDPPATDRLATDPATSIDTSATDTTPPPPTNTNNQNADATTTGTAIADTGSNAAASGTNSNAAGAVGGSTNPSANAGTTSGTAGATGSKDTTQVDQIATATTNGQGAVDILQVALVINLGVSNGQSGSNTAIAAGGPGGAGGDSSVAGSGAQGAIDTGNASAVGNRATTTITQAAVVAGGDASTQIAAVLNIGIAVGNTGLNVAVGNVTVDGVSAAQLTLLNGGTAAVQSGDADALGNRSDTRVLQSATGTASGTAVLQIGQWAIVLNFGTAFANTGANAAVAGTGPGGMGPAEYQAVLAIMNVLGPILDGLGTPTGSTVGNSSAVILTGDAAALGNDASTTIAQTAAGAVSGSAYASASQRATVANLGLALANTGYNASLANTGALDLASLAPATSQLRQFFGLLTDTGWLTSANPFASFAQSVDLGGLTLSLGGDISGTQFLLGWDNALVPDGGPITPGVRVRQISAVLNIGIALANSGSNTSLALVSGANTTTSSDVQALLSTLSSTQSGAAANGSALARIATGDASAVGSDAVVKICQAFHDALTCAPDPAPPTVDPIGPISSDPQPAVGPQQAVPVAAAVVASDPGNGNDAGSLPFTGSDPQALVLAALGLIGAGGVLARKRRTL
jgi:LPXTG-motif cell wall-anchored protein